MARAARAQCATGATVWGGLPGLPHATWASPRLWTVSPSHATPPQGVLGTGGFPHPLLLGGFPFSLRGWIMRGVCFRYPRPWSLALGLPHATQEGLPHATLVIHNPVRQERLHDYSEIPGRLHIGSR